jgi:hypothetical protein
MDAFTVVLHGSIFERISQPLDRQLGDKRTCPILEPRITRRHSSFVHLARTGNARIDIGDRVMVTEDQGSAGVNNCIFNANLSVISVDCNTVKLGIP